MHIVLGQAGKLPPALGMGLYVEIHPHSLHRLLLLYAGSLIIALVSVTLAIYIGRNERAVVLGVGFCAGIMLLVSFIEMMPEAMGEAGPGSTIAAFFLGLLIMAVLHWVIPHTHLVEQHGAFAPSLVRTAWLVAFGLILRDVPEGFASA
ncbi:hypothetical protein TspCOW1_13690 [Thiohalobacter sp. COW1]|uniref:Zinc transporter ZupT n=1 Tax=Thiohalobacter thiocyanaticus TaxID=585455 RepID=A0A1Z4VQP0_9GAMM|nr:MULTISPECIES: hypothetical protein [Thiohalobacter]BAZ93648.1 zinc transporter ZupT [Thiohalobacter thiocyanaticus]BCO31266.1 hypothetical protein TspCOW1_13690 [Thiohalobacter sp. COW1]